MRSQTLWGKRKRIEDKASMNISDMEKLLSSGEVDFETLFENCVLQSGEEHIRTITQKLHRTNKRQNTSITEPTPTLTIIPVDTLETTPSVPEYHIQPDFGFRLLKPYQLLVHQVKAVRWAQHREKNALHGVLGGMMSLEMGLGKTLFALALIQTDNYAPNLFVCNKSLLASISDDTHKFFGESMPFFVLHPDWMKQKLTDLDILWFRNQKFILTTYDVLVTLSKRSGLLKSTNVTESCRQNSKSFFQQKFHRIICDESQRFVNPKTQIFKALSLLRSNFRFCLTGTPIRNYELDLHTQLLFCGLKPSIKWSPQQYKELGLREAVHCVSMVEANVILPEKEVVDVHLQFTQHERQIYDSIFQNSVDTFSSFHAGKSNFAAVLLQCLRLRQVCIAPFLINDKKDISVTLDKHKHGLCSTKILRAIQIVREIPDQEKIIIFSSFTCALSLLNDALKTHLHLGNDSVVLVDGGSSTRKRNVLLDRFRLDERVRVLLITNNIGSVGLNLTQANHIILLETWWNDTIGDQAAARAWRIGQTKKVYVWRLVIKDSIEQRMLKMCQAKHQLKDVYLNEIPNSDTLKEIFRS